MLLRCHFVLKSVFIVGLIRFFFLAIGDNYVKTNGDTFIVHTISNENVRHGNTIHSFRRYKAYADIGSRRAS